MGFFEKIGRFFSGGKKAAARAAGPSYPPPRFDLAELLRRLELAPAAVSLEVHYQPFTIAKRNGQPRRILAPDDATRDLQRRILRRVLGRLRAHPAAHGFERGHSIATHAALHTGRAVLLKLDVVDFFASTTAARVTHYFRTIGWDERAAQLLTLWTTHEGGLPQGAPTSPRLSNLVNHALDARLEGMAHKYGAVYSRYADDLVFSWPEDQPVKLRTLLRGACDILGDEGYRLHQGRKLQVLRRHQRQMITGLVVNEWANLPRATRRRLRAIEHHQRTGRPATLSPAQLAGWNAFRNMLPKKTMNEER